MCCLYCILSLFITLCYTRTLIRFDSIRFFSLAASIIIFSFFDCALSRLLFLILLRSFVRSFPDDGKKNRGQIYAFPITALSSITHRVTGCALACGAAGLGAAELFGGSGTALYATKDLMGSTGNSLLTFGAKFAVSYPILYHYTAAMRHFYWDATPEMLTNADVEKSSYYVVGGSLALTTGLCLFF